MPVMGKAVALAWCNMNICGYGSRIALAPDSCAAGPDNAKCVAGSSLVRDDNEFVVPIQISNSQTRHGGAFSRCE
jgi:hypothetical protein